jgi:hypothetical protein
MQKHIAVIIDWYGPYSLTKAKEIAKQYFGSGVYIALGKQKYQKIPSIFQYIGISSNLSQRLIEDHEKFKQITRERAILLGEVFSTGIPGPKNKYTDIQLDLTEWAHAFFLKPPLNDKKTCFPPDRGVSVINRWWQTDFENRWIHKIRRPHKDLPDLIDYFGYGYGARIVWIGSKIKRIGPNDI